MKRVPVVLSVLVGAFSMATVGTAGEISYVGSSTVGKFIADAQSVYKSSTFKVDTKPESSGGESCPARQACDLGGVARDVNQKYLDKGVHATLIGKDAIAAIVHADNPVKSLTSDQLKQIFTGKITNWKDLGGPDMPIKALIVKKGSATRKVFQKIILDGADYAGTEVVTPDAKVVSMVARDKGAIGQISLAFIQGQSSVAALAVDGQAASLSNPSYPITRPLHLTTNGTPNGDVKKFVEWALSQEGQAVVKKRFIAIN